MNDINKKLQNILSGVNTSKLKNTNISSLVNSPEFDKLKKQLSNSDKQKIMNAFSGMNTDEIQRKLSNADLSNLSKMSASDIINKLKKL